MNLDAYFARIAMDRPTAPTLEALKKLHVAHLAAFTFDNIDIQRHGAIAVDTESVARKFLERHAGGYCFEQNTLFGSVLRELGFTVTPILARVCEGPMEQRSRSHMALRVDIDGEPWLADVGFGATGPLEPLRLQEGTITAQAGVDYSLRHNAHVWTLVMRCGGETAELYEFTEDLATEADVEIANYYISTHPSSAFRRVLTIQRTTPEERVILRNTVLVRYRDGERRETPVDPGDVRRLALEIFGIDLGSEPMLYEQ